MRKEILEIFSFKPEIVSDLPAWMVPQKAMNTPCLQEKAAIVETAGRDSIAAAIISARKNDLKLLLPSITYSGTEFGDLNSPFRAASVLKERLAPEGIEVLDPIISGSPSFWWKLCGRSSSQNLKDYGFYTPCIGCHLYFHTMRIPLARKFGFSRIIAGERESHNGRIKLNQLGVALDMYKKLCNKYGTELDMPLRSVKESSTIESILEGQDWEEGKGQLSCVLSKNYVYSDGSVKYSEKSIKCFLKNFALPEAEKQLDLWLESMPG